MGVTEELTLEHKGILLMLRILERISNDLKQGKSVDVQDLADIHEFLRVFADKCHHTKEETALFPAMREAGIDETSVRLGETLSEHERGRGFIRELGRGIEEYERGNMAAAAIIAENADSYIRMLRRHIRNEDILLFPEADAHIPEDKQRIIQEKFDTIEREIVGWGKHEQYHSLLEKLERKYLLEPL